eukprot:jgi/Ulvmu1/12873/UM098_0061.1
MADTAAPDPAQAAPDSGNARGALLDTSNVASASPSLSVESAARFRASYVDECAALFRACAALPGPVVPLPTPKLSTAADVTLRLIGPYIEGQSVNLETLVRQICGEAINDFDAIYVAVKNMVIQEANRKSYTHDRQAVKRENVLESTREDLLWRWEVKKASCLAERKHVALAMRAWLKKAQQCMTARLHAVKALHKLTGATITQRQQTAYEKAQHAVLPGAPPVPFEQAEIVLPSELVTMQNGAKISQQGEPQPGGSSQDKGPSKERKSEDAKETAESRGFGGKSGLDRSRGMMAMFVQKVPQGKPHALPVEEKLSRGRCQDEDQRMQYIIDGLQNPGEVDVVGHWKQVLQQKWKPLGQKMENAHVPGLPPAFARRKAGPRESEQLAKLVLGHIEWQGVRTWRRKLLFFPSDSNRPPFYGSFSRHSHMVRPRRVFAKDPDMDYEVLSDEEWEEEPEGEELDGSDGDDERYMDEDEDTDGFMVADGYLSEDERAHDYVDDAHKDMWDATTLKADVTSGGEAILHSAVGRATTSYLNVLLNAKIQGQPVVIARSDGPAAGEGIKTRSAELLQPLHMYVLDATMTVVRVTASNIQLTPATANTSHAESTAAAAALQEQVGPFVDSLSDESAKQKSAIIHAIIERFAPALPRSRIATAVLPAAAAYCGSYKRWFSKETIQTVTDAKHGSKALSSAQLPAVNSAALHRATGQGTLPLQLPGKKLPSPKSDAGAFSAMQLDSETKATLCTPESSAAAAPASFAVKKRRLQPIPADDQATPLKHQCMAAVECTGNAAVIRANAAANGGSMTACASIGSLGCAPSNAGTASGHDVDPPTAATDTATHGRNEAGMPVPLPQPPQPGEGGIAEWMRDNPDRPRLPGGSSNTFKAHEGSYRRCPPMETGHAGNSPAAATRVMTRQPWRRTCVQRQKAQGSSGLRPGPGDLEKEVPGTNGQIVGPNSGKENKCPSKCDLSPYLSPLHQHPSPLLPRVNCTAKRQLQSKGPAVLDLSPPERLNLHSVDTDPAGQVDLTAATSHDDDDATLQAALLASIAAEDHSGACTPALLAQPRQIDTHGRQTHSDTSLAAQTLQTLVLGPSTCVAKPSIIGLAPTAAGAAEFSPPTHVSNGKNCRKRFRVCSDDPVQRATAQRIPDFNSYQLKRMNAVSTHLQACMNNVPRTFQSWRALCTYLGMIPSLQDAAALNMAQKGIGILDFLKPVWNSESVFAVPSQVMDTFVRMCSICRVEWLQKATMKCIVAITISIAHRCIDTGIFSTVASTGTPGCLSLAGLACNECLLHAMVQRAVALSSDTVFKTVMLAKQALKVLEELLQSSLGGQVATRLAGMQMEGAAHTALHELVQLKDVSEPKAEELINSVLLHAFKRVATSSCSAQQSRILPQECTRSYMVKLLKDVYGAGSSEQRRSDAVDILEALLSAPGGERCDANGQDFVAALASMQHQKSSIMANRDSKGLLQFKKLLKSIFMPDSNKCICSHTAPATFRLCRCLLAVDGSPQLQSLVVKAFKSTWGPQSSTGPNIHQLIQEAVTFYVKSSVDDPLEEREKAVVIDSAWDALDSMLKQLIPLDMGMRTKQIQSRPMPRPAALRPADTVRHGSPTLQGNKRAGSRHGRHNSKGHRMMHSAHGT